MITNPQAPTAYPISCFTWVLLYQEQAYNERTETQARETVQLLNWMTDPEAQEITTRVHYSPLPQSAITHAKSLLQSVTYNGKKILKSDNL